MPRLILYTGKGGVGKSTIACATALKIATLGHKALLISADPAHSLGDVLAVPVSSEPKKVWRNLWAMQIDPVREVQEDFRRIGEYLTTIFPIEETDEALAYEVAMLPALTNILALLKIQRIMEAGIPFDVVILDMIPSGEAIRCLYLPRIAGFLMKRMRKLSAPIRAAIKVFQTFRKVPLPEAMTVASGMELAKQIESLPSLLEDVNVTSLRLVANPDTFCIRHTRRFVMQANIYNINVDLVILNKILPPTIQDPHLSEWKKLQHQRILEAMVSFYPIPIKELRLFEYEPRGIRRLIECANELFREEDPSQVYYVGSCFRLDCSEEGIKMSVKVPFAEKEKCEVERIGDKVIMKVQTDIGEVVNVIPLPSVASAMRLSSASLIGNELQIHLTKVKG